MSRIETPSVRIVVVNGGERAGKRTFCEYVAEACAEANVSVSSIRAADPVREWLRRQPVGWEPESPESEKDRALIRIAMNAWQTYNDGPFQITLKHAERSADACSGRCLIFVHAREGYFIARILDHFRIQRPKTHPVAILVDRPGIDSGGFVGYFGYDWIVHNRGTLEDLRAEAERFLAWIGFSDDADD